MKQSSKLIFIIVLVLFLFGNTVFAGVLLDQTVPIKIGVGGSKLPTFAKFEGCDNCSIIITLSKPFCGGISYKAIDRNKWGTIVEITGKHSGMEIRMNNESCAPDGFFQVQKSGGGYDGQIRSFPVGDKRK